MSSPRYVSIQPAAGSQSGPPALLIKARRSARSISSDGLPLDRLQFWGTQAPQAMPPIPPLIVAAGMRSSSLGVDPGPSQCGVVGVIGLLHADPPGVVESALAHKNSPGPSGFTPVTGDLLSTKGSHAAYRAKPSGRA